LAGVAELEGACEVVDPKPADRLSLVPAAQGRSAGRAGLLHPRSRAV